ncbi:MAG: hypothetical protein ABI670_15740 [Chloroflexota bacterium]
MDSDRTNEQHEDNPENDASEEHVAPSGLLAGGIAASNMGSGMVGGLGAGGGGALGAIAAAEAANSEETGEGLLPMDMDALGAMGRKNRDTGDEGVSANQRDLEADEMNG